MNIVEVTPDHHRAISDMTTEAFARADGTDVVEAKLIDLVREAGDVVIELAAFDGNLIVGHALFSKVRDEPFTGKIAGLGPVCARVGRQRSGIGSAVIRAGLERCRALGVHGVIVLGNPKYYGRFGFSVERANGIACAYAGPYFQALELEPGAFDGTAGVAYAPAFAEVGA